MLVSQTLLPVVSLGGLTSVLGRFFTYAYWGSG